VKNIHFIALSVALLGGTTAADPPLLQPVQSRPAPEAHNTTEKIILPAPNYDGKVSVEQALLKRRSVREYKDKPLTLNEVSQLLWAAQGITEAEKGLRTAPSAGATYPIEVYVVIGNVGAVKQGAYKYAPGEHQLISVRQADVRAELAAALGQARVGSAGVIIGFFAVYERTTAKFGEIGVRYVHMEVGHAAQNVYLQAAALSLGTGVIGSFPEEQVKKILNVPENEQLLYIMPVGRM
jgi:SagB-type dehydrogenase family enzyme